MKIKDCIEYKLIKQVYGDDVAKRSQVPLINHIDEGLKILSQIGANLVVEQAYCLHPLVQNNTDLASAVMKQTLKGCDSTAIILAMEYRAVANSYLCRVDTDNFTDADCIRIVDNTLLEIKLMLVADKTQNYKDFLAHHKNSHVRSAELEAYFSRWIRCLKKSLENSL